MNANTHIPVLHSEIVTALNIQDDSVIVDATYGRGGHSKSILSKLGSKGRMLVIDRDRQAIEHAVENLQTDERVDIVHASFSELLTILSNRNLVGRVTGILFDFGVSSPQLDDGSRGFSFNHDGPLDMRMDQSCGLTAADWLSSVDEKELTRVIKIFGEERFARRVARAILTRHHDVPLTTTAELSAIVSAAVPTRVPGKHPATRTFQAIRIAVNKELEEVEQVLPMALESLAPGGRLVVISFHSLEDRLVKRFIREQSKGDPYPPDLPVTTDMLSPKVDIVGKPVKASQKELIMNPRSRSAVLRVAEKTVN